MTDKPIADSDLLLPEDEIGNPFVTVVSSSTEQENHKVVDTPSKAHTGDKDDDKDIDNDKQDEGEDEDDEPVDIESEVELWKFIAQDELYMLLKEDPGRYLPFLESNRELAQKHGCLVTRDDGKLRVKFRIFPEDRWTECGYFDDFDDAIIHQEFSEAVQRSLNMSRSRKNPKNMSRDEYLKDVHTSESNRAHVAGEIDGSDVDSLRKLKGEQLSKDGIAYENSKKSNDPIIKAEAPKKVDQGVSIPLAESGARREMANEVKGNALLDAYLAQILDKMGAALTQNLLLDSSHNHSLDKLVTNLRAVEDKIPRSLVKDYRALITGLVSTTANPVYTYLIEQKQHLLPRNLEPVFDNFLMKLAYHQNMRLGPDWTEEKLYDLLGLSKIDIQLLQEHKVKLRELWNNSL